MKKRILFLVLHRKDRSPGQRYRHEQYVQHLESCGFECVFSPMLSEKEDRIFYSAGHYISKIMIGLKCLFKRLRDTRRARHFDVIYIYRDAFFFGTFIERRIRKSGVKIVYDFDDAIWLNDENPNQGLFNRLKTPDKVATLIELADRVVVGNQYLANYARKFNGDVRIIPSTVDMDRYSLNTSPGERICIGWTGSFSTLKHFEWLVPALIRLKEQFGDRIYFKLIGVPDYENSALELQGTPWQSATEVKDLAELDIGIMPLPDNPWTQGKCGMKGLQYMALGVATIMSPVGVNVDIIREGENGLLASDQEEWLKKLSLFVEDAQYRLRLGEAGRKTVRESYSVEANRKKWLEVFEF